MRTSANHRRCGAGSLFCPNTRLNRAATSLGITTTIEAKLLDLGSVLGSFVLVSATQDMPDQALILTLSSVAMIGGAVVLDTLASFDPAWRSPSVQTGAQPSVGTPIALHGGFDHLMRS
jgi:hypothetical protein